MFLFDLPVRHALDAIAARCEVRTQALTRHACTVRGWWMNEYYKRSPLGLRCLTVFHRPVHRCYSI
jgi:hypothetical protein